jgi:prepilin-type N-terminal cleavage/methylation domain-containing protein
MGRYGTSLSRPLLEKLDDLARLSVSMQLRFLENRRAVGSDLEPPTARRNQLNLRARPPVSELSRQTGSSGLIVSKRAVFDRDFHELDVTHADATRKNSISLRSPPVTRCRFTGGSVRNKSGFTIIESSIAIALIAALTAITVPRAMTFIDSIEVRGAVTEIESMLSLARHTAIAHGSQIAFDIDVPRRSISIRAGVEVLRTREVGLAHGVMLSTNRSSITYSPIGVGYGAANFSLVVSRGRVADTVVVSRLGRVRH